MHRIRSIVPVFALGLAVSLAGGCANEEQSLVILQNQVPGADCVVSGSLSGEFRSRGIIDVRATRGYIFTPVVVNYARTGSGVTEAQRLVKIQGADIELQVDPDFPVTLPAELASFSQRFSGTVFPDGATAGFSFPVLPLQVLDLLEPQLDDQGGNSVAVQAQITVFGEMGGSNIRSDTFTYWIDVCDGCLLQDLGPCSTLPSGFVGSEGGSCNTLQDAVLECCSSDGVQVCPARAEASSAQ